MERIQLKEPGEELILHVLGVKPETVDRTDYWIFSGESKEVRVPASSVKGRLERMKVAIAPKLVGKTVRFARSTKTNQGGKPYWEMDLATEDEIRALQHGNGDGNGGTPAAPASGGMNYCTCRLRTPASVPTEQKCPICDGTGVVSRPPGVTADQPTFSTARTGPWPCPRCNGLRTIIPTLPASSELREALNQVHWTAQALTGHDTIRILPLDEIAERSASNDAARTAVEKLFAEKEQEITRWKTAFDVLDNSRSTTRAYAASLESQLSQKDEEIRLREIREDRTNIENKRLRESVPEIAARLRLSEGEK